MRNPKRVKTSIPHGMWIKLMSRAWEPMGEWKAPGLYEDIYCQGLVRGVPEFFPGVEGPKHFLHFAPVSFQDVTEYSAHSRIMAQRLRDVPALLPELISKFQDRLQILSSYYDLDQNASLASSPRSAKRWLLAYLRDLYDVMPYSYIFNWGKEAVIGETTRSSMRSVAVHRDIHAIYRSFFDPPPPKQAQWFREEWALVDMASWVVGEYRSALSLLKRKVVQVRELKQDYGELYRRLDRMARDYGWLGVRHMLGKPRTTSYYLNRLREILIIGIEAKRQALESIGQEAEINFTKFLASHELTSREKSLLTSTRELVGLSTLRVEAISRSAWAMRTVFNKVAQTIDVSPRGLLDHSWQELQQNRKEPAFERILKSRARGYAYIVLQGDCYLVSGIELRMLRSALGELEKREPTLIRGQSASAGLMIGEARVILEKQQFQGIPEGCVLVIKDANELDTNLLQESAGIVADQGGILSKVASFAREMGIPCVVGTAVGTEIIRDGNILEVDGAAGTCLIRRPRPSFGSLA